MKIRKIIRERPALIPKNWKIMNAPRPLMGHKLWTSYFVSGVFHVALDPDKENYDEFLDFNVRQDATVLEYISRQDVVDDMVAYYQDRPKLRERLKDYDLSDIDVQDQLVETWFNLEMNWSGDANEETE